MSRNAAATAAGLATLGLVTAACTLAWRDASPLVPRGGGVADGRTAWVFFLLLAAAFTAYLAGLALVRLWGVPLVVAAVLAAAVQLVPLGVPLLLSTDAWTYWAYGSIAAREDGNPYRDEPSGFPDSPAYAHMGAAWRDTTTVYGPAFTLASEPVALAVDASSDAAAWTYKALAGLASLGASLLAARIVRERAFAVAFVGWNPLLAVHLAGGGHNDAWVGAALLAALALASARRAQAAGAVWVLAITLKWVPLVFFALRVLEARATRRVSGHLGFALAAAGVLGLATWRYGLAWLDALGELAGNAALETSYALPHRLEQLGIPGGVTKGLAVAAFVAGLVILARWALRGRARLGLAACLVLATTPYLAVWYLAWAIPLAAADEDRWARLGCLAFCVYLLPQTIPL